VSTNMKEANAASCVHILYGSGDTPSSIKGLTRVAIGKFKAKKSAILEKQCLQWPWDHPSQGHARGCHQRS
jgi:hypothetical protein